MRKFLIFVAFALFFIGCGGASKSLSQAIKEDNIAEIQHILKTKSYADINEGFGNRMNALMYAIRADADLETIKFLVSQGVDVNFKNSKGQDPVYYAVYYDRLDVLQYLLSINAKSYKSIKTLKKVATKKGYLDMLGYLNTLEPNKRR